MRAAIAVLLFVSLIVLSGCPAQEEPPPAEQGAERGLGGATVSGRRVALVIGNNSYSDMPRLRNAVNDARSMRDVLRQLDFAVSIAENTSLQQLEGAVDTFIRSIRQGDIAFFFYAGHGIQIDGENFLVPTDFDAVDEADAKYDSYSAERVRERMEGRSTRLNIIVLDACRNNPFSTSRSGSRGLAAMSVGTGTYISFSTAPGQIASDNPRGENGLFTSFLIEALRTPGLNIDQVFNYVRTEVHSSSDGRQVPWSLSSVIGEFHFISPERVADTEQPAEPGRPTEIVTTELPGVLNFSEPFLLRLRRRDSVLSGDAYLKIKLSFEVRSQEIQQEMESEPAVMSRIRDNIYTFFARQSSDELDSPNWPQLKQRLLNRINDQLPERYHLQLVHFEEFLIQPR